MRRLPIGTRSLLWGAHQVALHPLFVALAWRRLYGGWPRRWPEWVAIVCHDWGYWGLDWMDGPVGELHPMGGARLVARLVAGRDQDDYRRWYEFTASHSRTYARILGVAPSPLMQADKLGTHLYPRWLYALLVWLSGEYLEYRDRWVATIDDHGRSRYPGSPDDGPWAYAGHLQANWARFRDPAAVAGQAYGGE